MPLTVAKSAMSTRKIVVLTTSSQVAPAASSTAVRLAITRSVSGSMPPSTRTPLVGSRAAWPEQNRKPSLTMPWL